MRLPLVVFLVALVTSSPSLGLPDQTQTLQVTPGQPVPGQPAPGQPATPPRAGRPNEPPPKGTAVIRGSVTAADTGSPIRRAQVRAFSSDGRSGGVTQTDANGRYEIKDLPAGRYTLNATKSGFVNMQYGQRRPGPLPGTPLELSDTQIAEKVNFTLPRGAAIGGRVVDEFGEPISTVQVMAVRYQFMGGVRRLITSGEGSTDRTDDQGAYRLYGLPPGDYFISASLRNTMVMFGPANQQVQGPIDGYAPTYYPGTPSLGEAQRVTVRAGQDMQNISFALSAARLARVSGRAINSAGEPVVGGQLMAEPRDSNMMPGMMAMSGGATVRPDGTFQLAGLPPGNYTLNVQPMRMGPNLDPNAEIGRIDVVLNGNDVENVLIVTARGGIVRGHIVTDEGTVPPFKPQQLRVFANPAEPERRTFGSNQPKVNDDFSFEITGLTDRSLIGVSVDSMSGTWTTKSVLREATELIDAGIDAQPGSVIEDIQVVITDKVTELTGLVTNDRNQPVIDATVVVFPSERERWTPNGRRIRQTRPDTQGRYRVRLPPGDYLAVVVQNLEPGQGSDPEFLERARETATRLSIDEGDKKTLDLRVSSLQP